MKNCRIKCEVSKTVQERQYEPYQIVFSVEGDIGEKADIDKELDILYGLVEERVCDVINQIVE